MGRYDPIAVKDTTAASMLDMTPSEFRRLVEGGHLPPARTIGGIPRWDTGELRRIISGQAASSDEFEP